jgi:hypothetical protein
MTAEEEWGVRQGRIVLCECKKELDWNVDLFRSCYVYSTQILISPNVQAGCALRSWEERCRNFEFWFSSLRRQKCAIEECFFCYKSRPPAIILSPLPGPLVLWEYLVQMEPASRVCRRGYACWTYESGI